MIRTLVKSLLFSSLVIIGSCKDSLVNPGENNLGRILVDASKDRGGWWFPQASGFSSANPHQGKALAEYLRGRGFIVDELTPGTTITDSLLNQYNKIIRANEDDSYSASEFLAYDNFLNRSTSLILISEYLRPGQKDEFADRIGINFTGATQPSYGVYVSQFANHEITNNALPFEYIAGSAVINTAANSNIEILGWLDNNGFLDLDGDTIQDVGEPTGVAVMGILHHPTSKIFFIGEINGIERVPQPLVKNLVDWAFQ